MGDKYLVCPSHHSRHTLEFLGIVVAACLALNARAATLVVDVGQDITAGVAAAADGDTVLVRSGAYSGGIVLTRSISLMAEPGVTVHPSSLVGPQEALIIQCSDCSIEGFIFEDFNWAIDTDTHDRARISIKSCVFRRSGTAWIDGDAWLVDGCEFDRPNVSGALPFVEDYMNLWGSNHTIHGCFFHGLNLSTDLPDGAHNDAIQMFTEGSLPWQRLTNVLIDGNIFADFMQAIWISNVDAVPNAIQNIVVRNNVFWGEDFFIGADLVSSPHAVMFLGHIPGVRVENNIFHKLWNNLTLYSMDAIVFQHNIVADSGNVYTLNDGTLFTAIDRGTMGNLLWNSDFPPDETMAPDTVLNPYLRNPNAVTGIDVIGPDGIPFTADDAWRPASPGVEDFGPQIAGAPSPWLDTDGDGVPDLLEIQLGTNPNDPNDFPILGFATGAGALVIFAFTLGGIYVLRTKRIHNAPSGR